MALNGTPSAQQVFHPGANVTIELVDDGGMLRNYSSIIQDFTDNEMSLCAPVERMVPVRVQQGREITVYRAIDQTAYASQVCVLRHKSGDPPILVTTAPVSVECQPRRRFFRVDVEIPYNSILGPGTIVNASGNGLLLVSSKDCFKPGRHFDIQFKLPTCEQETRVRVKVMREFKRGSRYLAGVVMLNLNPKMQDELIKFLLARQRELVQMGLLFSEHSEIER